MRFIKQELNGLILVEPDIFPDNRGYFLESYDQKKFSNEGIEEIFVQDNVSVSKKGTLRGLHYQLNPHAQGKLVSIIKGDILDVAVDIRKNSPTYGRYLKFILNDVTRKSLYLPPGFAHGFLALTEAIVLYKCTNFYAPEASRIINWRDKDLNIDWTLEPNEQLISAKDQEAPSLKEAENNFIYNSKGGW